MIKVVTLSSSSKGNSVLIVGEQTNMLIDAGINLKTLIEKLNLLKVEPSSITAILSTHEHSDHSKSVGAFIRKFGSMLYCYADGKPAMLEKLGKVDERKIVEFYDNEFLIGEFTIKPFKLPHDSASCVGFRITVGQNSFAYATDLGFASEETINNLKNCKLVILESNHDEKMLQLSNRPYFLKQRILAKTGHLSNKTCVSYLKEIITDKTKNVILAHLSEECNDEDLALNEVKNAFPDMKFNLYAARQKEPLDVIEIGEDNV